MPLATKTNTAASNIEPKVKRAKLTEKKLTAKQKKAEAAAAVANETAEDIESGDDQNGNKTTEEDDANNITQEDKVVKEDKKSINDENSEPKKNGIHLDETKEEEEEEDENDISDDTTTKAVEALTIENKKTTVNESRGSSIGSANNTMATNNNTTAMLESILTETSHTAGDDIIKPKTTQSPPGFALCVGENLSNQLGLGCDIDNRKKPQIIKELPENIIQISAGGMHSACLTSDGVVYTFGCNDEFALGRGSSSDDEICKVDLPEKCVEVTAGDSLTAALSETGVVYAWGTFRDGSGVLGLEQKKIAKTPMKFKLKEKIVKISSGADHLVFLTKNGDVYTAGNSEHGQLGRISKYNSCRGGRRGCDMILLPGLVRISKKRELQGHKKIENIWTSSYCTYLQVKDSNLIVGFGLNNCYQLGVQDMENRYQPEVLQAFSLIPAKLRKIAGGMHHTLALDVDGHVYTMGSHRYGCLGLGNVDADVNIPTQVPNLNDIVDIAGNTNVSYAVTKSGKVYSWGTNYSKQLCQDTEDDYLVPTLVKSKNFNVRDVYSVDIGGQHSLFVASDEKDDSDDEMN